jgi:hypothetical protein
MPNSNFSGNPAGVYPVRFGHLIADEFFSSINSPERFSKIITAKIPERESGQFSIVEIMEVQSYQFIIN